MGSGSSRLAARAPAKRAPDSARRRQHVMPSRASASASTAAGPRPIPPDITSQALDAATATGSIQALSGDAAVRSRYAISIRSVYSVIDITHGLLQGLPV
jgi:hypothetical protein